MTSADRTEKRYEQLARDKGWSLVGASKDGKQKLFHHREHGYFGWGTWQSLCTRFSYCLQKETR